MGVLTSTSFINFIYHKISSNCGNELHLEKRVSGFESLLTGSKPTLVLLSGDGQQVAIPASSCQSSGEEYHG